MFAVKRECACQYKHTFTYERQSGKRKQTPILTYRPQKCRSQYELLELRVVFLAQMSLQIHTLVGLKLVEKLLPCLVMYVYGWIVANSR